MPTPPHSLGCVSFLNSKPLIDPLLTHPQVRIHFAVPSQLLALVESNTVSTALMSVVDFQTAQTPLLLLPAGMIGCDGPTLTVRLYSRVPPAQIRTLHADTDSHTSVILAQLILRERFHLAPPLSPLAPRENPLPPLAPHENPLSALAPRENPPESMLLIGDKVVNASPDPALYPHQLDLGEQWKLLTGLPFVFAMWMIRADHAPAEGAPIYRLLDHARQQGSLLTDQLLDRYAAEKGWPRDLARRYFTQYLRYQVTPAARDGLAKFFHLAQKHALLPNSRPIAYLDIPQ